MRQEPRRWRSSRQRSSAAGSTSTNRWRNSESQDNTATACFSPQSACHKLRGERSAQRQADSKLDLATGNAKPTEPLSINTGSRGQTPFALVRNERQSLAPFFLTDEHIFAGRPETFIPDRSMRALFPFGLLPKLSETSLLT